MNFTQGRKDAKRNGGFGGLINLELRNAGIGGVTLVLGCVSETFPSVILNGVQDPVSMQTY